MVDGLKVPIFETLPFFHQVRVNPDINNKTIVVTGLDKRIKRDQLKHFFNSKHSIIKTNDILPKDPIRLLDGSRDTTVLGFVVHDNEAQVESFMRNPKVHGTLPLPIWALEDELIKKTRLYSDPVDLKKNIDEYMWKLDEKTKLEQEDKNLRKIDDQGFTLVSSGVGKSLDGVVVHAFKNNLDKLNRLSTFVRSTNVTYGVSDKTANKKRKGGHEEDFYRFQIREKKQKEYATMKQKVEAEKIIVDKLSKAKKFKI